MATAPARTSRRRLGRDDWTNAALEAIARGGLSAVAVEPLAVGLGVTKGSFYAHFSSRDELIEATLARWEESHGRTGLLHFGEQEDPAERLREVLRTAVTFSQTTEPSVHVSLLGELGDARVRASVARVTESRLAMLTRSYRQLGLPPRKAADRARIAYATYLGLLQMAREAPDQRLSSAEISRITDELSTVLIESR